MTATDCRIESFEKVLEDGCERARKVRRSVALLYVHGDEGREEHGVDEACRQELGVPFRPRRGIAARWLADAFHVIRATLSPGSYVATMDVVLPPGGAAKKQRALDLVLSHVGGFRIDEEWRVHGALSPTAWAAVRSVLLLLFTAVARLATLVIPVEVAGTWLGYMWPLAAGIVALLCLEWSRIFVRQFADRPSLKSVDQQVQYLAQQIDSRQRLSPTLYLLALPLAFFASPVLAVVCATQRPGRVLGRSARIPQFVCLIAVVVFLATAALLWSLVGNDFGTVFQWSLAVAYGAFLATIGLSGCWLIVRRHEEQRISEHARIAGVLAFAAVVVCALVPAVSPSHTIPILAFGSVLAACALYWFQQPVFALVRLAAIQRLGEDARPFLRGMWAHGPQRLVIVGLWNADEDQDWPPGYAEFEEPLDDWRDVATLLTDEFGDLSEQDDAWERHRQMLAQYLNTMTRRRHKPIEDFIAIIRKDHEYQRDALCFWLHLCSLSRFRYHHLTTGRRRLASWRGEFREWLEHPFLFHVAVDTDSEKECRAALDNGQLPELLRQSFVELRELPTPPSVVVVDASREWEMDVQGCRYGIRWSETGLDVFEWLSLETVANREAMDADEYLPFHVLDVVYQFETDVNRGHFEKLHRKHYSQFAGFREALTALALFFGMNAEEALRRQGRRATEDPFDDIPIEDRDDLWRRRVLPTTSISASLLVESGLLSGLVPDDQIIEFLHELYNEGIIGTVDPITFARPSDLSFLTSGYFGPSGLFEAHDKIISQFIRAGERDPVFLKVASAWAFFVQDDRYFRMFFSGWHAETDCGTDVATTVRRHKRQSLLLQATSLLVDYYGELSYGRETCLDSTEIEQELDVIAGPEHQNDGIAPGTMTTLSIREGLWECDQWASTLKDREGGGYSRALTEVTNRWNRFRIRRQLLIGDFRDKHPDWMAQVHVMPRYYQDYYWANIRVERGEYAEALKLLLRSWNAAKDADDVLHAKVTYYVVRCLAGLGLMERADKMIKDALDNYHVYLKNDDFLILMQLAKAMIDIDRYARQERITWRTDKRLGPIERLVASESAPTHIHAALYAVRGMYEMKYGKNPEEAMRALRRAYLLLEDNAHTLTWQALCTRNEAALVARRRGHRDEVRRILDTPTIVAIDGRGSAQSVTALETSARLHFDEAHFKKSALVWLTIAESTMRLGGTPLNLPSALKVEENEFKDGDGIERLKEVELALEAETREDGAECPDCLAYLRAVMGISNYYRINLTLKEGERERKDAEDLVAAKQWSEQALKCLSIGASTFWRFLRMAATDGLGVGDVAKVWHEDKRAVTLVHLLCDQEEPQVGQSEEENDDGAATPPVALRALSRKHRATLVQMEHFRQRCLWQSKFYNEDDIGEHGESSKVWNALCQTDDNRCRVAYRQQVARHVAFVGGKEGTPIADHLNSATLRAIADRCRLRIRHELFSAILDQTRECTCRPDAGTKGNTERGKKHKCLRCAVTGWQKIDGGTLDHKSGRACLAQSWDTIGGFYRVQTLVKVFLATLRRPDRVGVFKKHSEWESLLGVLREIEVELDEFSWSDGEGEPHAFVQEQMKRMMETLESVGATNETEKGYSAFLVFPKNIRAVLQDEAELYEEVLQALREVDESDLTESLLNRLSVLEFLRDASCWVHQNRREMLESQASPEEQDKLFRDLDVLRNTGFTTWARDTFFPYRKNQYLMIDELLQRVKRDEKP